MDQDQQIGFQGGGDDEDEMPPEMRAHMLAAFAHEAGLGPHPGMYKGPPRKKRDPDEPTDSDRQRAEEEPLDEEAGHEAHYAKMRAAQMGGSLELGPTAAEQQRIKQSQALQQETATQQAVGAQQAQAQQTPQAPPPAPTGPVGTQIPYPAQRGPQPAPGVTAQPPSQQGAPPSDETAANQ